MHDVVPRQRIPILALLAANTISQLGNVLALLAIPWFVYATTGSAAKTGFTGFANLLPVVVAGLFGGVIVDRIGHRQASIIADVASGLTLALIPILHLTIGLAFWQLLVLVFFGALLDMPGSTARQSLLPELATLGQVKLERANAAYQSIQQTTSLVGLPLAGLLIATLGATNVLWLDAASFAISAGLVAVGVPARLVAAAARERPSQSYRDDLLEGWRFLRRERVIFSLTVANSVGNFLAAPLFAVILPIYASQVFGSAVHLGLLLTGAAVGSLVGAILYGLVGVRLSRRSLYAGSWLVGTVPFWILAGTPPIVIALVALALLGLAEGPINPLMYTLSQERTPAHLRARVFGARMALANIVSPLGMIAAGLLIEIVGVQGTLIGIGLAHGVFAIAVLRHRPFYSLDVIVATPVTIEMCAVQPTHPPSRVFSPDRSLLLAGLMPLSLGLILMVTTVGRTNMQVWGLTGALLVAAGWIIGGMGLRPGGSRARGALLASSLYLGIGLLFAIIVEAGRVSDRVIDALPPTASYPLVILSVVVLWPLAMARLLDPRSART